MKNLMIFLLLCGTVFGQQVERKLVWEENFDGETLNGKFWNIDMGNGCPICGWGNNERQLYNDKNVRVENGNLIITAKRNGDMYTSGRINSKSKKEFKYGRMEARAKLPMGQGLWPTFWMLGFDYNEVGWPKSGEIDILEYVGREPHTLFTTLHTPESYGSSINTQKTIVPDLEESFHIYAIEWTKDKIDFFIDEHLVYTFQPAVKNENTWPFNKPFYFIINTAIGGNFGGQVIDNSIFPQEFVVDYVKVYQ
jgi:beta-glucanase (GH16 family)